MRASTYTRTHTVVAFADPHLRCEECSQPVPRWHDPEQCRCKSESWNEPCRHRAGVVSACPSWSPVDGCRCAEHLGYVPHEPAADATLSASPGSVAP